MHQRKSKKIVFYFFLLFIVGSINNINLNNLKLKKVSYINVIGLEKKYNSILFQEIKNLNLRNIFLINKDQIINTLDENSLVEKYTIFKRYPSSIDISIQKTNFLAKINIRGQIFYVGSNGKLTKKNTSYDQLPFIFGNPKIDEFLNFKRIIDQSKISYDDIKNLYFFSSNRWDLELKNGVTIRLSKDNVYESLQLALDFLRYKNLKNFKIIDVRIKNQIIIND